MSKRIVTLDFLRGLSILVTLVVHVLGMTADIRNRLIHYGPLGLGPNGSFSLPFFILAIIFLILGNFRGFFLMISSIVHIYSMTNALKRGVSRSKILGKTLFFGFILLLFSIFHAIFLHEWSVPGNLFKSGTAKFDQVIRHVYLIEALGGVAWGIIFTGLVFFFLTSKKGISKRNRNIIILVVLAAIVVIGTEFVQTMIENYMGMSLSAWGFDPSYNPMDYPNQFNPITFNYWWQYITRFFLTHFFGLEAPMFPMLAYVFVGCTLGFIINQKKVKRKTLRNANWIGLACVLAAPLWLFMVDWKMFGEMNLIMLGTFHPHPTWYLLLAIGLQVIFINCLLMWFEFNPRVKWARRLKRSQLVRRFGVLALTVFSFSSIQYLIRYLLSLIFSGSFLGLPFVDFREIVNDIPNDVFAGTSLIWATLPVVLDFSLWWGILRLWERGGYKGSLEWCMLKLSGRKRGDNEDLLNIQGVLYNVQPVVFVKPHDMDEGTYYIREEDPDYK